MITVCQQRSGKANKCCQPRGQCGSAAVQHAMRPGPDQRRHLSTWAASAAPPMQTHLPRGEDLLEAVAAAQTVCGERVLELALQRGVLRGRRGTACEACMPQQQPCPHRSQPAVVAVHRNSPGLQLCAGEAGALVQACLVGQGHRLFFKRRQIVPHFSAQLLVLLPSARLLLQGRTSTATIRQRTGRPSAALRAGSAAHAACTAACVKGGVAAAHVPRGCMAGIDLEWQRMCSTRSTCAG